VAITCRRWLQHLSKVSALEQSLGFHGIQNHMFLVYYELVLSWLYIIIKSYYFCYCYCGYYCYYCCCYCDDYCDNYSSMLYVVCSCSSTCCCSCCRRSRIYCINTRISIYTSFEWRAAPRNNYFGCVQISTSTLLRRGPHIQLSSGCKTSMIIRVILGYTTEYMEGYHRPIMIH
jgi:hypothetical protein